MCYGACGIVSLLPSEGSDHIRAVCSPHCCLVVCLFNKYVSPRRGLCSVPSPFAELLLPSVKWILFSLGSFSRTSPSDYMGRGGVMGTLKSRWWKAPVICIAVPWAWQGHRLNKSECQPCYTTLLCLGPSCKEHVAVTTNRIESDEGSFRRETAEIWGSTCSFFTPWCLTATVQGLFTSYCLYPDLLPDFTVVQTVKAHGLRAVRSCCSYMRIHDEVLRFEMWSFRSTRLPGMEKKSLCSFS